MTNEQLAEAVKAGDRDKLLELWEAVRRFAYQQARRWAAAGRGGTTVEDLQQEAFLALLDTLEGWDNGKGAFLTWYGLRLKAAFTAATKQRTQRDRLDPLQISLSFDAPLTDSQGDPFTLANVIPDTAAAEELEAVEERERQRRQTEAINRALSTLPENQRSAIVARYWEGRTVDAGTIQKAIRALRRPAVAKLIRWCVEPE